MNDRLHTPLPNRDLLRALADTAAEQRVARYVVRAKALMLTESKAGRDAPKEPVFVARRASARARSRVSRAIDGAALSVMRHVFLRAHRRSQEQLDDASGEASIWQLAGEWLARAPAAITTPSLYFPLPRPATVDLISTRPLHRGHLQQLRLTCETPDRPAAIDVLRRYPRNAHAQLRHYRHESQDRPAAICLHGWGGGYPALEAKLFAANDIYELGFDVYLYTQPYHGTRTPEGVTIGAALHPSTHVARTNEAFLQTALEVRAIAQRHQQLTGKPCGVIGHSLGGYGAAMLAAIAPEMAFAAALMPIADFPALLWSLGEGTDDRRRAERSGVTFDDFCRLMAVHAPLFHRCVIPQDRLMIIAGHGDGVAPPSHARALWQHWGQPQLHWYDGGHFVHFGRSQYMRQIRDFLVRQRTRLQSETTR